MRGLNKQAVSASHRIHPNAQSVGADHDDGKNP
jgi:hypothetical protein